MIIIIHQRKVLSFASVLILVFHSSYSPAHDTHYTENNPRHQPKQYINKSFHDLNSISHPNIFGKYSKNKKTKKPLRYLERLLVVPKAGLEPARLLKDIGF